MRLSVTVVNDSHERFESFPIQAELTSLIKPVGFERFPEKSSYRHSPVARGASKQAKLSVRNFLIKSTALWCCAV